MVLSMHEGSASRPGHVRLRRRASRRARALAALIAAPVLVVACDGIPRDPEGTLDRVRAHKVIRIGLIAAAADMPRRAEEESFVAALEARTGARAQRRVDSTERLLTGLEHGELDVVVGELSSESPWKAKVTILPPLRVPAEGETIAPHVVVRNGENAWVALLIQTIRAEGGS